MEKTLKDIKQTSTMYSDILRFIRDTFQIQEGYIPLHEPRFWGNEQKYVAETIASTFVSSVGTFVTRFEETLKEKTGAKHAVAIVNGTCALHLALKLAGVENEDEVITQPLTFIATANAIHHAGGIPHFVDVDADTMGLSPSKLKERLLQIAIVKDGKCYNKETGKRIAACMPMHTFGMPLRIDEVIEVCNEYYIPVVEDAAESIGSLYKGKHTGTFGLMGTLSLNGNKTITSGAGGAILTNDDELGKKAKHLSTTAKIPHAWAFIHDDYGYNYRMPNLNAALACAQMEQLDGFIENKRALAEEYNRHFERTDISFIKEIEGARANYWLMTILVQGRKERDAFLQYSNDNGVMTRPAWELISRLSMYKNCPSGEVSTAQWLEDRIVNIPSSVRPNG